MVWAAHPRVLRAAKSAPGARADIGTRPRRQRGTGPTRAVSPRTNVYSGGGRRQAGGNSHENVIPVSTSRLCQRPPSRCNTELSASDHPDTTGRAASMHDGAHQRSAAGRRGLGEAAGNDGVHQANIQRRGMFSTGEWVPCGGIALEGGSIGVSLPPSSPAHNSANAAKLLQVSLIVGAPNYNRRRCKADDCKACARPVTSKAADHGPFLSMRNGDENHSAFVGVDLARSTELRQRP